MDCLTQIFFLKSHNVVCPNFYWKTVHPSVDKCAFPNFLHMEELFSTLKLYLDRFEAITLQQSYKNFVLIQAFFLASSKLEIVEFLVSSQTIKLSLNSLCRSRVRIGHLKTNALSIFLIVVPRGTSTYHLLIDLVLVDETTLVSSNYDK